MGARLSALERGSWVARLRDSAAVVGLLLTVPASVVIVGALIFPLAYAAWVSVVDFNPGLGSGTFVGLNNYVSVLADPVVHRAILSTARFVIPAVIATTAFGLALAVVLHQQFPGRALLRSLLVVPWALGSVITGMIWGTIFNSSFGILNRLLELTHLINSPVGFLGENGAPFTLAFVFAWSQSPIAAFLFLSGLQSIPVELDRAAAADGAGAVRRLFYITLPLLRPAMLVVLILVTFDAFVTFGLIFVLTGGGPGDETTTLSWLGYVTSFRYLRFGEGTAIYLLLTAVVVILGLTYYRTLQGGGVDRSNA